MKDEDVLIVSEEDRTFELREESREIDVPIEHRIIEVPADATWQPNTHGR